MPQPLSYSVTSLAPDDVDKHFFRAKQHFGNFFNNNTPTKPEHYILKNLAHVTLKRLFYLKDYIRDEEVRSALNSIQFQPIHITGEKLELFRTQKHGNVLVVLIYKTPAIQKLHDDLSAVVDNAAAEQDIDFEKKAFNPHHSVLYNLPEEQVEDAKEYVTSFLPIHYVLQSFLFMRDVPGVIGEREMLKEYFAKQ